VLVPTFRIKDPEEQKKARQELAQGALKEKLALLNKLVVGIYYTTCYKLCYFVCVMLRGLGTGGGGAEKGAPGAGTRSAERQVGAAQQAGGELLLNMLQSFKFMCHIV
jgi:hypothetical protein